jgi:hypothetical protein
MQAIELVAHINPDHELRLKLPQNTGTGPARVIVLFESDATPAERGNLNDLLGRLPRNESGGASHEGITRRIDAERACWGDA